VTSYIYDLISLDGPLHRGPEQPSLPAKVSKARTAKRPDVVQESEVEKQKKSSVMS